MPISEQHKKKRGLNLAIGLTLGAMVVLFFAVTVVRIGENANENKAKMLEQQQAAPAIEEQVTND